MSGKYSLVSLIGLLPFVLAACNDATSSSSDPRTQPPLVRIETVEISVRSERSFTGIVAARVQSDLGFRSEEHTSELQSHSDLVCRLLLEKKKKKNKNNRKQDK